LLVLLGVTLIVLFVAVFPTSEFIAQRSELASSRAKLETAHSQVAALEEGLDDFNDRVSVGRIARERFSLVNEGEQLYRLSTRAGDSANLPEAWLWPGYARLVQGD
jgi:cell division protein FtsB